MDGTDFCRRLIASDLSTEEKAAKLVAYKRAGLPANEWSQWLRLLDYELVQSVGALLADKGSDGLEHLLNELRSTLQGLHGLQGPEVEQPWREGFSEVSITEADMLLTTLGFVETIGWEIGPRKEDLRGLRAVAAFDYSDYPNEDASTPAFVEYHQRRLEANGIVFGRGGYSARDLHNYKTGFSVHDPLELRGRIDAGIVPHGVASGGAGGVLRVGFEHKMSSKAKERHILKHPTAGQVPQNARALQYRDSRPQAICALLAAQAQAHLPLDIDLTDGEVHHILRLRGTDLMVYDNCSPAEAYHLLAEELKQNAEYKVSRVPRTEPPAGMEEDIIQPCKKLRQILATDSVGEQMLSILPMEQTAEDRLAVALDFVHQHTQHGGDLGLPECVKHMYA